MSNIQIKKVHGTFTINPELLAKSINENYELIVQSEFYYIDSGFVNANFKFTAREGVYVVRFFGEYSEFTDQEITIQSQLVNKGLTTPKVLRDLAGRLLNDLNDYKYAIFDYIPGSIPQLDKTTAYRVGKLVGSAQNAFKGLNIDVKRPCWIEEKYNNRFNDCKFIEENYISLNEILSKHEYQITPIFIEWYKDLAWDEEGVSEQIIHADIYNPNLLDDGKRLALLDFETVAYGPAVIDSMTYLAWDLLAKDEYADTDEKIFARIESYLQGLIDSGGFLENPEFCYQLISAICVGASVANIAKAIKQKHNAFTRLERYFDNVEFAMRNRDRLISVFTKFTHKVSKTN